MPGLRPRAQDGFTLVEVLVSMLLLVVGIFAGIGLFSHSQDAASTAERTDLAVQVAMRELEKFRALPYAKVAVRHDVTAPAPTLPEDPRNRILGVTYDPPDEGGTAAPPEPLVDSWADPADQSVPLDYERVNVTVGSRVVTARVYRFVSWHNQECPLLDLSALQGQLASLRSTVAALVGGAGSLTSLTATIDDALADVDVLQASSLISTVLGPVRPLLGEVESDLGELDAALSPVQGPLQALLTEIDALVALVGSVDPCDIPAGTLPDLSKISTLRSALDALVPHVDALLPAVGRIGDTVAGLRLSLPAILSLPAKVSAAVVSLPSDLAAVDAHSRSVLDGVLSGVVDDLTLDTLDDLATETITVVEALPGLLALPDHPRNLKRVSVAVWLETPASAAQNAVGPQAPVWASTLVRDPDEGLL